MFTHILVPLDGSKLAEQALAPAAGIAEAMSARLTLLRVVPPFALLAADPMLYEEMNRMGEDESLSYLRSTAEALNLAVPIEAVSDNGQPADSIIQFAGDHEVDLILMSSHGRSGVSRWIYGSVAERVLRQAPCATCIINARIVEELPQIRKVLVPLDGSNLAERALAPGRQLAAAMGAELHLLRVTTSAHQLMETPAMKEVFDEIEDNELLDAETYLESKRPDVDVGDVVMVVKSVNGTVAATIVDYTAEQQIEMIVMSSHGRTGLQRWVYGSVAEMVLRSACCATMIIRR